MPPVMTISGHRVQVFYKSLQTVDDTAHIVCGVIGLVPTFRNVATTIHMDIDESVAERFSPGVFHMENTSLDSHDIRVDNIFLNPRTCHRGIFRSVLHGEGVKQWIVLAKEFKKLVEISTIK